MLRMVPVPSSPANVAAFLEMTGGGSGDVR